MADTAPMNVTSPSGEAVKAAMDLLLRVTKTWSAVPELSRLEEEGLGLLVVADLVERRLVLGLRAVGDGRTVRIHFRFSGQRGLAQALEPGLAEAWSLWEKVWGEGKKVYVEPPQEAGQWRLTRLGGQEARKLANGDVCYVRDLVRTPGVPGMENNPPHLRFVPGVGRPVCAGEGHLERVEVVNAGSEPLSVWVENLDELSGPLGDMARAVQAGLDRRPKAKTEGGKRATRARPGPARLPYTKALRYVQLLRQWADVREANDDKPPRERTTRVQFVGARNTNMAVLRSAESWYRNHRNSLGLPYDPRKLTDEDLAEHFPER